MVSKFWVFLGREAGGLHQAAFLLGFFAFLSQLLALVRDKLLAHYFGAGAELDVYYASFRVPDFLFVTLGSLVSLSVLIPFIIKESEKSGGNVRKLVDSVFTVFLTVLVAVCALAYVLLPELLPRLFLGFSAEQTRDALTLTRILLLSPIVLGISNLFGSLVQANNRFLVYAVSPLLYNAGIIFGALFLIKPFGLVGLAVGVVLGALLHLLIQLPTVSGLSLLPRFTFSPDWNLVRGAATVSVPRTISLSVSHISVFFLVSMASLMAPGSITVFNFAWNLQSVPLAIFGVSYSLAAFPALSKLFIAGDAENFLVKFVASAKHIIFWIVPCTALFFILRAHIVRVILGSGAFDWYDTRLTAAVLALFVLSLVFQAIILLCLRGLYAMGATGKPFYITILGGASIVIFSYIFAKMFELSPIFRYFLEDILNISDVPGTSVVTLGLGFSMGSAFEALLLWRFFAKRWRGVTTQIIRSFVQVVSASVVLSLVAYGSLRVFNLFFSLSTFWGVVAQGALSAIVGIAAWFLVLRILNNQELPVILSTLRDRYWRVKPTSPDTGIV